jgi:hypothetical protein
VDEFNAQNPAEAVTVLEFSIDGMMLPPSRQEQMARAVLEAILDRVFVCTKEYWKVVPSESIHRPLVDLSHPDEAVESLIVLSRQTDSLGATCIVADIVADPSDGNSRKDEPILVGAYHLPPWGRT